MEKTPEAFVRDLLLSHTKQKPICSKQICDLLNATYKDRFTPTTVRIIINRLRRNELPVIANNKGYFVSYDLQDITDQIQSLENRVSAIKAAQLGLRQIFNQIIQSN